jgi:plasmid stabilization system protein ParE
MLRFVIGRFAEADLEEQSQFLSTERGSARPEKWLLDVFEVAEGLIGTPEIGRVVSTSRPSVRVHAHRRRFTLVYAIDGDRLILLRVYSRGQNIAELLDRIDVD